MSFSEEIEILQNSPDIQTSVPPNLEIKVGPRCYSPFFRVCIIFTIYLIVLFGIAIASFTIYIHYSDKLYAPLIFYLGFLTTFVGVIVLSLGIFRLMDYYRELQSIEDIPPPVLFPLLKVNEKDEEKDEERKEEKEEGKRKKKEEKGELYECVVCRTNHREVFSRRCRHISMCIECANSHDKCPICTKDYQRNDLVRIFFS